MLKVIKYNQKNSFKNLEIFLEKRKSIQKSQTSLVSRIISNVKKKGDIAVLKYEKKYSKIKNKSNELMYSSKEINQISKKLNLKTIISNNINTINRLLISSSNKYILVTGSLYLIGKIRKKYL